MTTLDRPRYKVIGTRPVRHDGVDKVTGRAKYGADVRLAGILHGAVLRSPHAHARIKHIDTTKAKAMPGVQAVVTSSDMENQGDRIVELGEGAANMRYLGENVLARGKVLYTGHAVAAVAADNIHQAEEALGFIEVAYEVLPPVLDVRRAMEEDAVILHEDLRTQLPGNDSPANANRPTNVAARLLHEKGNIEKGFAEADVIVEREFNTSMVHQGYIEPHCATAHWNADGKITIWTSTQGAFSARQQTAELLRVPLSNVKVVPMEIGGGFGGKISVYLEPVATLLSKHSGRPVKITMKRAAVFEATGPTPGSYMRLKVGATHDGRITAGDATIAFEAGGFPGSVVGAGCGCVFACYDVPNGRIEGFDVCVNKPHTTAYRAPGSTQVAFAMETVIDEICEKIGADPIEFRLVNGSQEGTRRVDGPVFGCIGMRDTVEAVRKSDHYQTPLEGKFQGRGIATGYWFNAGMRSSVSASVNADGTVSLIEGSTDIGGTRTSLAMQLAETLGITAEAVIPTVVDTDSVGYTDVTGGSRVTFATGIAVVEAGKDIQNQMVARAAMIWGMDANDVRYVEGKVHGPGDKRLTFEELAAQLNTTGGPIVAIGAVTAPGPSGAFATHLVDVEVDPDTGKVQILRYTAAQDVGTAIHPSYVEGQLHGGAVQGIGWALNEEYWYDDQGALKNATYLDYRMPTCYDVPNIETILVEVPDPAHPYGVRGVGEVPICPPPAAIANAIHQAIGIRMTELPMSPPRVLEKLLQTKA